MCARNRPGQVGTQKESSSRRLTWLVVWSTFCVRTFSSPPLSQLMILIVNNTKSKAFLMNHNICMYVCMYQLTNSVLLGFLWAWEAIFGPYFGSPPPQGTTCGIYRANSVRPTPSISAIRRDDVSASTVFRDLVRWRAEITVSAVSVATCIVQDVPR